MAKLVLTITTTKRHPDVLWPNEYVRVSTDPAINALEPALADFTNLGPTPPFVRSPLVPSDDGQTKTLVVTVDNMESVPGLTVDNAYDMFVADTKAAVDAAGTDSLVYKFYSFRIPYQLANFIVTHTVAVE